MAWTVSNRLLAIVMAMLSVSACGSRVGPCPPSGYTVVRLTPIDDPITSVSTDSPCTAAKGGGNSFEVYRQSAGTCRIVVQLESGEMYAISVEFRQFDGGNCPDLVSFVDASVPELLDAGADGG